MCCPSKSCCLCLLIVLVVIAVGFVFGFGIFAHGFQKIKNAVHVSECGGPDSLCSYRARGGRPFFSPPPPF